MIDLLLAGPVEFSTFDIAMIVLITVAPAILVALAVGFIMARRREPGHRLWYGVGVAVLAFILAVAIEASLAGIVL